MILYRGQGPAPAANGARGHIGPVNGQGPPAANAARGHIGPVNGQGLPLMSGEPAHGQGPPAACTHAAPLDAKGAPSKPNRVGRADGWESLAHKMITDDNANGLHKDDSDQAGTYRIILNNVPEEASVDDLIRRGIPTSGGDAVNVPLSRIPSWTCAADPPLLRILTGLPRLYRMVKIFGAVQHMKFSPTGDSACSGDEFTPVAVLWLVGRGRARGYC